MNLYIIFYDIKKLIIMAEEIIALGDYYQYNMKSGRLGNCATFIWTIERADVITENSQILLFKIEPVNIDKDCNLKIRKALVIGRDGRVKKSQWYDSTTLACKFNIGSIVKYWMPLQGDMEATHRVQEVWTDDYEKK